MVAGDIALRCPGADERVEYIVGLGAAWSKVRNGADLREAASERVQAFMAAFAVLLWNCIGVPASSVKLTSGCISKSRSCSAEIAAHRPHEFGEDGKELPGDGATACGSGDLTCLLVRRGFEYSSHRCREDGALARTEAAPGLEVDRSGRVGREPDRDVDRHGSRESSFQPFDDQAQVGDDLDGGAPGPAAGTVTMTHPARHPSRPATNSPGSVTVLRLRSLRAAGRG